MTYFRSLFCNFLAVFMVCRLLPGIEVGLYQHVPNIGANLLFSTVLGFCNASVFAALFIFGIRPSIPKIVVSTGLISFVGFYTMAIIPYGVQILSLFAGFVGAVLVWAVAFATNYFEWHRGAK